MQWVQPWATTTTTTTNGIQTWQMTTSGLMVPQTPQQQAVQALQRKETVPPPEPLLPYREQVDPIVGYKRAKITADPFQLYGVGMNAPYNAEDRAVCKSARMMGASCGKTGQHDAPFVGCGCGFYAMPVEWLGRIAADYGDAVADVQVELYGKVIVHEKGWRAEYQRVLGVWIDPVCAGCKRLGGALYKTTEGGHQRAFVWPACKWCAKDSNRIRSKHPVSIGELENEWKVEVRWGTAQF